MEIYLIRKYFPTGTNGELKDGEMHLCFTIELPWNLNSSFNSCIPEGKYQLVKRFTKERKWHLELNNVSERYGILIHPANYAIKELKGCIAPVTFLDGPGIGSCSKKATELLNEYVFEKMKSEIVFLVIMSKNIQ